MIHQKKRRRKPRLFEVWVDWNATWPSDGRRLLRAESRHREELQPLAMSIHHSHSCGPSSTYAPNTTSIEPSQVLGYYGQSKPSWRCGGSPPSDPLPSPPPDETRVSTPYQPPISTVSTARICTFVSMPCPSRASYTRSIPSFPSSSHDVASPSFLPYSYPRGGSFIMDEPLSSDDPGRSAVAPLPPNFALGVAYYIV